MGQRESSDVKKQTQFVYNGEDTPEKEKMNHSVESTSSFMKHGFIYLGLVSHLFFEN